MVNADLLNNTVKEIRDGLFKWNQEVWVGSNPVPSGLSPDAFDNECGTAYCFAGRVASLKRDVLYNYDRDSGAYYATAWLVPIGDESAWSQESFVSQYFLPTVIDGKMEFVVYKGEMILAENAAVKDLGINHDAADDLFAAFNDIHDIEHFVEEIIEKGDAYGEDEDHDPYDA